MASIANAEVLSPNCFKSRYSSNLMDNPGAAVMRDRPCGDGNQQYQLERRISGFTAGFRGSFQLFSMTDGIAKVILYAHRIEIILKTAGSNWPTMVCARSILQLKRQTFLCFLAIHLSQLFSISSHFASRCLSTSIGMSLELLEQGQISEL